MELWEWPAALDESFPQLGNFFAQLLDFSHGDAAPGSASFSIVGWRLMG